MRRLEKLVRRTRGELAVYRRLLADPATPRSARWLLHAAVAYLLLPFDLIPDWIPVLGQIDDLVLVPILVWLALRHVPGPVLRRARKHAAAELSRSPRG